MSPRIPERVQNQHHVQSPGCSNHGLLRLAKSKCFRHSSGSSDQGCDEEIAPHLRHHPGDRRPEGLRISCESQKSRAPDARPQYPVQKGQKVQENHEQ